MMATVPHVISGLGLRKFQADGFLLTRVYQGCQILGQLRKYLTGHRNCTIQGKFQTKMGRHYNTRYLSTKLQKLDSLCPRSNKMEKGR